MSPPKASGASLEGRSASGTWAGGQQGQFQPLKCLQCGPDVQKSSAPGHPRCKPRCQIMRRIPAPKQGQDTQLRGEPDLAS